MTISQTLSEKIQLLHNHGLDSSHLDAELLLAAVLKKPREFLFAHPEHKLTPAQARQYTALIKKRLNGVPAAYLTGHKSFYGLDFIVNKQVLIPRPETEMIVDEMPNAECRMPNAETVFIDVGTGSGCIIISLAKQTLSRFPIPIPNYKLQITNYKFFATDISREALTVARKNAKLHGVDKHIKFLRGDLLAPVMRSQNMKHATHIIITANLPYLTPVQIKNSPSIKHEPKLALSAGPDGLKYYRQLFSQIQNMRSQHKMSNVECRMSILCEIDPGQSAKIKQLAKHELPKHEFSIKKDLAGYDRLAIITLVPAPSNRKSPIVNRQS